MEKAMLIRWRSTYRHSSSTRKGIKDMGGTPKFQLYIYKGEKENKKREKNK